MWTIFALLGVAQAVLGAGLLPQVPSVNEFAASGGAPFLLTKSVSIVVNASQATTGSPSLLDYAQTFRSDLAEVTGFESIPTVRTSKTIPEASSDAPVIFLTVGSTANHTLYNGAATGDGYDFEISQSSYVITGATPIGAWYGTRTLLQQLVVSRGNSSSPTTSFSLPAGSGSDTPGWEVRGFMLDAGRHWFEASFLADLCIYASFFKLNEFHIHASDNLWNPDFLYVPGDLWKELYAAFRFRPAQSSINVGLEPRLNETWSESDWAGLLATCTAHGIKVIPEIDNPGHSLVFSQWKPELMIPGQPDSLNLSYPDTIPTLKGVWDEFLPWFTGSDEVSIGADEYDTAYADEYISFVNEMSDYIFAQSGKSIRVWGTLEPSTTESISTNITIQHWDFPAGDIPVQLMDAGYSVINSEQYFLYLDGKTSDGGEFPQSLNESLLWSGAPGGAGWAPNIFTPSDTTNNTSIDNPRLRGAIFVLWNDWGNNATTALEIYYQLSRSVAIFGEKTWAGSGTRASGLTQEDFDTVYPLLNAAAPGQNLNRVVPTQADGLVFSYEGALHDAPVQTKFASVGPPYTLNFRVKPSSDEGTLFEGEDSILHVSNLTFEATGQLYRLNYSLPLHEYTNVTIRATWDWTYAVINGAEDEPMYWLTEMDIWAEYMAWGNMSFAAPSSVLGGEGFQGSLEDVVLKVGI